MADRISGQCLDEHAALLRDLLDGLCPSGQRGQRSLAKGSTPVASWSSVPTWRYDGDGDVPSAMTRLGGCERLILGADGQVTAIATSGGSTSFQMADLHGDIVATMAARATSPATEVEYDEFGRRVWSRATPALAGTVPGWLRGPDRRRKKQKPER